MNIASHTIDAARELSAGEVDQVTGGCQMGFGCNCPGATKQITPDGSTYQTNTCDGEIWISPLLNHASLRTA